MLRSVSPSIPLTYPKRFARDEDGGILVLCLFIFVMILMVGGIGVDIANHERTRTRLQTTLDTAVLAAGSLTQDLDPKAVVRSYLASAGLDAARVDVVVDEDKVAGVVVGRTVTASYDTEVDTFLMHMLGIDQLGMEVASEASEHVEDVEISLVLDVSGSMGMPSQPTDRKIIALRAAASDFVADVLGGSNAERISISLVPYSTQVNAGAALLSQYTTTSEHSYSNCVDFTAAAYTTTALDPSRELQRAGHFQFQGWSAELSRRTEGQWTCRIDPGFEITPLSNSLTTLQDRIAALTAQGSTSIDIGVKWGLALLDPSAQGPVSGLIRTNRVEERFRGRPHPFRAPNVLKILVIMTDGQNDTEYRLNPDYASGLSPILRAQRTSTGERYYSVPVTETTSANDGADPSNEPHFFAVHPWGTDRQWNTTTILNDPRLASTRSDHTETPLTWPEVWAEMSPQWYSWNIWARRFNSSRNAQFMVERDRTRILVEGPAKDDRLKSICQEANNAGVVVFTIGFEVVSQTSHDLLRECASNEAQYFDVAGGGMKTAFKMIANSIGMLRITQ